jgi:WD40 repeat protein
MSWPLSQDYNEAVQDPATGFGDPELKQGQAAVNSLGIPMPRSGNFADVYEVTTPRGKWAVKCFTRQIPGLGERYKEISAYLKQTPLPFMVEFSYLEQGIRVRSAWYPVLKMHWVEGFNLNQFVKDNLERPQLLDIICQIWVKLATRLDEAQMAHCDLQHGNVLLVPGTKAGSLAVKLVDYDGMCVPALSMLKTIEVGHPNFQHPQRAKEGIYSLEVDHFSHLVIYTSIRALMTGGRGLWQKYDNGDNLLFRASDFEKPAQSALFRELGQFPDAGIRQLTDMLVQALARPLAEAPRLPEIAGKLPPVGKSTALTRSVPPPVAAPPVAAPAATANYGLAAEEEEAVASPRPRRRREKKGHGLLWGALAAGLAFIFLAVGGVAAFMFLRHKPTETPVAQNARNNPGNNLPARNEPKGKQEKQNEPNVVVEPNPDPMPRPVVDPGLLARVDLTQHVVSAASAVGKWTRTKDGLQAITQGQDGGALVAVPADLPGSYDLRVQFTRARAGDTITVIFPVGPARCQFWMDYFETIGGLSLKEHVDPRFNRSKVEPKERPANDVRHTLDLEVRVQKDDATIRALLDDQPYLTWKGKVDDVAVSFNWPLPGTSKLGIGCGQNSLVTFHSVTVREADAPKPPVEPVPGAPAEIASVTCAAPISNLSISADGKRALGTTAGSAIYVWELDGGRALKEIHTDVRVIYGACFLPGDREALVTRADGALEVIDLEQQKTVRVFEGKFGTPFYLAVTPDGKRALSGGGRDDQSLHYWDVATGRELRQIPAGGSLQKRLSISADGQRALMDVSGSACLWDSKKGAAVQKVPVRIEAAMPSLLLSSDGKRALICSGMQFVYWDVDKNRELARFTPPQQPVSFAFSPDGRRALVGGSGLLVKNKKGEPTNGVMSLYDLEKRQLIRDFESTPSMIDSVAFTPDGRRAVSSQGDRTLRLWQLPEPPPKVAPVPEVAGAPGEIASVTYRAAPIHNLSVSADGKRALGTTSGRAIYLWELDGARAIKAIQSDDRVIYDASFLPGDREALVTRSDGTLEVLDLEQGKVARTFEGKFDTAFHLGVTADGKRALSGGRKDPALHLWDVATGRELSQTPLDGALQKLSVSADGQRALIDISGGLYLWDANKRPVIRKVPVKKEASPSARLSPDGKRALICSGMQFIYWDVDNNRELARFTPPQQPVSLAFSADGRRALAGGSGLLVKNKKGEPTNGVMSLYDLEKRQLIRDFESTPSMIDSVAFTPDGRRAVSSHGDRTLRLWQLPESQGPVAVRDPAPAPVPGQPRSVPLRFKDGTYVELANSAGLLDWNKDLTIEMNLKLPEPTRSRVYHLIGASTWHIDLNTGNDPQATWIPTAGFAYEGRGTGASYNGKFPLTAGGWHHVAFVHRGTTLDLYVDGKAFATRNFDKGVKASDSPISIGGGTVKDVIYPLDAELRGLRISSKARYQGLRFTPPKQLTKDASSVVLLDFSGEGDKLADLAGDHDGKIVGGSEWVGGGQ